MRSSGCNCCAIFSASGLEDRYGSKRCKAMCAAKRNTVIVTAMVQVAAQLRRFHRRTSEVSGPNKNAMAAKIAGRRSDANDSPLRSSMCDIESVSLSRSCVASTVPMSGTNGRCRELHNPATNKQPEITAAIATKDVAPISQTECLPPDASTSEDETAT